MTTIATTRRGNARPALISGLLAAAALLALSLLQIGVSFLPDLRNLGREQTNRLFEVGFVELFLQVNAPLLAAILAVTLAVFVSFSMIAPIAPQLRAKAVIARGLVAGVVHGAMYTAILFGINLIAWTGLDGGFFRDSFPRLQFGGSPVNELVPSILGGMTRVSADLPLVVLAGVLLWIWLQRHPLTSQQSDSGEAV